MAAATPTPTAIIPTGNTSSNSAGGFTTNMQQQQQQQYRGTIAPVPVSSRGDAPLVRHPQLRSSGDTNGRSISNTSSTQSSCVTPSRQKKSLLKKKASLSQYQTTSIDKHYHLSRQILQAFDSHWSNHFWVTAYAVGLQYVETALIEIPKHGYYHSDRHERERMDSCIQAARVAHLLQELLSQQHHDPPQTTTDPTAESEPTAGLVPNGNLQQVQKLLALAMEQIERASSDQDHGGSTTTAADDQLAFELARAQVEQEMCAAAEPVVATTGDWIMMCDSLTASLNNNGTNTSSSSMCLPYCGIVDCMGGGNATVHENEGQAMVQTNRQYQPPNSPSKTVVLETYSIMSIGTEATKSSRRPSSNNIVSRIPEGHQSSQLHFEDDEDEQEQYTLIQKSLVNGNLQTSGLSRSIALQEERLQAFANKQRQRLQQQLGTDSQPPSTTVTRQQLSKSSPVGAVAPAVQFNRSTSQSSIQSSDDLLLEKALFLSGLEVSVATDVGYTAGRQQSESGNDEIRIPPPTTLGESGGQSATVLELSTLANFYHEDFDSLQQTGQVRISFADTFQGRLPESTNGCTVIAPLLCIQHLLVEVDDFYYNSGGDPGLSDSAISHVIDNDSPVVLSQLRGQLGLTEHAFLIPADAHDYLLENEQLTSDQFQTVIGGNILHDDHLKTFITAIDRIQTRKIAATLFFHEHVVAILKLKRTDRNGNVVWWYDFIDSLPLKLTLQRCDENSQDLCQRLGLLKGLTEDDIDRENEMVAMPKTARIRCLNAEALMAVIRWYACSKFNEENIAYIDQYPWDDGACDFDPRVFQAFIWGGAKFNNTSQ